MVDIITSYDAAIFAIIMDKPYEPIIVPEKEVPKCKFSKSFKDYLND